MEKIQYIGVNKIIGVTVLEDVKTPGGAEMVKVFYENNSFSEIMPKKSFEILVSDAIEDTTISTDKKIKAMTFEILQIVGEYDINVNEINILIREIGNQIALNIDRAMNYLWTKDDSTFIPGINPAGKNTLLEAKTILNSIINDKPNNPTE